MLETSDLQLIREVVSDIVQESETRILGKVKIMINAFETIVLLAIKEILDIKFEEINKKLDDEPSRYEIYDWFDRKFQRLAE